MPRIKIPHSDDPGFVWGAKCKHMDGHIVLIDRDKTAMDMEAETQWVILHVPTYLAVTLPSKTKALAEAKTYSTDPKGKSPWISEVREALDKVKKPAAKKVAKKKKAAKKVPKSKTPRTGTRDSKRKKAKQAEVVDVEVVEGQLMVMGDPQEMNNQLVAKLDERFSNDRICDLIDEMLDAHREYKNKQGETISIKDWATFSKGIELALKYKIGTAINRMEVKNTSDVSWEDLKEMAMNSPSFYQGLKDLLAEVEAAHKEQKGRRKR